MIFRHRKGIPRPEYIMSIRLFSSFSLVWSMRISKSIILVVKDVFSIFANIDFRSGTQAPHYFPVSTTLPHYSQQLRLSQKYTIWRRFERTGGQTVCSRLDVPSKQGVTNLVVRQWPGSTCWELVSWLHISHNRCFVVRFRSRSIEANIICFCLR